MHRITLPGTTIETTALGFGCSALLGPRSRREGLALLGAAYDAGIRHFDVARYYGYGDAEGLVGEFLRGRRDRVTVTSKFGIKPMRSVAKMRALVGLARRLMRLSPGLRRAIGGQARNLVHGGAFGVDEARASLETSLRALGTDRIDLYLLHEGRPDDCRSPGLRAFLEAAVQAGKIGRFGVGSDFEHVAAIARTEPAFAHVVQFENSVLRRNLERLEPAPDRAVITHRALSSSFGELRRHLAEHPEAARRWSRQLDADCGDAPTLAALMLAYAVQANRGGVVLFSSTRPEAIRANVRAVTDPTFSPDQVRRFAALARELDPGRREGDRAEFAPGH